MTTEDIIQPSSRLPHFPIGFFSMTMGLFGTALAFHAAGLSGVSLALAGLAAAAFIILVGFYAAKIVAFPSAVIAEWNHPIKIAFFPAFSISLMLAATLLLNISPVLANVVWSVGAILQAILTLAVITSWIGHRGFGAGHMSPVWFIPAVGNVVAPVAGMPLGYVDASWYFFSVGVLFWIILLTLVINRLVFHDPLPGKLRPTLVILIAPPAVAFLAWVQLNGGVIDAPARMFLSLGLFFTALVSIQIPGFLRLPFALSFWALSFPFAAMTIACFRYADLSESTPIESLGWGILAALVVIITALAGRTLLAVLRGEVCQPD